MMKKGKKWRRKENEKKSVAGWIWVVRLASELATAKPCKWCYLVY